MPGETNVNIDEERNDNTTEEPTKEANSVVVEVSEEPAEDEADETDTLTANDIDCDQKVALTEDASKVKFLPATSPQNGDTKIVTDTVKVALDKEELMKYVKDPFWVTVRWAAFIIFWLIWVAMLIIAIVVVVFAPKCPERTWWQKSPIYEIYVRSFKDSSGDGIGDLKGVESKLDYLEDLGIKTIWLSPIYKSPMADFGYDVEDYKSIDPMFGTMEDFDSLMAALKSKDMKILMDFIPNHSSKKHEWFQKSIEGEIPYADYYIWSNPINGKAPNNWLSVFGGSAWTWNKKRQQFYYHQFLSDQPDLNLRNPTVIKELKEIMKFWLDKGVDGFRMDAVNHLVEDIQLRDEPRSSGSRVKKNDYDYLDHIHTSNQSGTFDVLREFRQFIDEYNETDNFKRIMVTEAYGKVQDITKYYGTEDEPIAHFPFNFGLISDIKKSNFNGITLNETVRSWLDNMPSKIGWANWVIGNHDVSRLASRLGEEYVDIMNMITLLLPGTPVTYYGEEIGMSDVPGISYEETKDPFGRNAGRSGYKKKSRDPERAPMQWTNKTNSGFTFGIPWLPLNNNYRKLNVETQKHQSGSHLNLYKKLVKLREEKTFLFANVSFPLVTKEIFSFARIMKGAPGFCVVANLGNRSAEVDISKAKGIPEFVSIYLPRKKKGPMIKHSSSKVPTEAKSAIILQFPPKED